MVSGSHSSMGSGSASMSVAKSATDTVPRMATTILLVGLSRASMYGRSPDVAGARVCQHGRKCGTDATQQDEYAKV